MSSMNADRGGRNVDLRPRGGSGDRWNDRDARGTTRSGGMWRRRMRVPDKSPKRGPNNDQAAPPQASLEQSAHRRGTAAGCLLIAAANINQRPAISQQIHGQVQEQQIAMNLAAV